MDQNNLMELEKTILPIVRSQDHTLFDGYSSDKLEKNSNIEVVGSGNLRYAILEYSNFLKFDSDEIFKFEFNENLVLNSSEIDAFSQELNEFKKDANYGLRTGVYLTKLIQRSYDSGNFDFNLNLEGPKINWLCGFLSGTKENPIKFRINGGVGKDFCASSKNITSFVKGFVSNNAGSNSYNCMMFIDGDVGDNFGITSRNLTAYISGHARGDVGFASGNIQLVAKYIKHIDARRDGYFVTKGVYLDPNNQNLTIVTDDAMYSNSLYLKLKKQFDEGMKW